MIYSDAELEHWWRGLLHLDREKLLERMVKNAGSIEYKKFAESLQEQYRTKATLSARQIANVRKWSGR